MLREARDECYTLLFMEVNCRRTTLVTGTCRPLCCPHRNGWSQYFVILVPHPARHSTDSVMLYLKPDNDLNFSNKDVISFTNVIKDFVNGIKYHRKNSLLNEVSAGPGSWLGETKEEIENHYQFGDGQKLPILSSSLFPSFVYFPSSNIETSAPLSLPAVVHAGRLAHMSR